MNSEKVTNSNLEFRKIPSLKYLYEINSNGTILRNVKSKKQIKIKLDMHHSKTGYYATFIHFGGRRPGNYCKRVMIHKVVAECWLGPCPEGYEVDHIDRNSHNNDYRNLRYVTKSEQMKNRDHTNIAARGKLNLEYARIKRAKPVAIHDTMEGHWIRFKSESECARYIEKYHPGKYHRIMYRISVHRKKIYQFEMIYDLAKDYFEEHPEELESYLQAERFF